MHIQYIYRLLLDAMSFLFSLMSESIWPCIADLYCIRISLSRPTSLSNFSRTTSVLDSASLRAAVILADTPHRQFVRLPRSGMVAEIVGRESLWPSYGFHKGSHVASRHRCVFQSPNYLELLLDINGKGVPPRSSYFFSTSKNSSIACGGSVSNRIRLDM